MTFEELISYLKGKRVYIQTHNFPDPDAIGAGFGLKVFLKNFGIDATLCYSGKIDRVNTKKMVDLIGIEITSKESLDGVMNADDPIICIDSQKDAGNITDLIGDEVATIDHHPDINRCEYLYKDIRLVGSCCTIITDYFEKYDVDIPKAAATALLYGLQMDTDRFSRGVTDADVHAFSLLLDRADKDITNDLLHNQLVFDDLRAYGAAISNITIFERTGFAYIPFACPDALIAITCDFILSLDEVDVAIVYSKRADGFKFSVRSLPERSKVDCGKLISKALSGFGSGGGHAFMAGGFIPDANVGKLGPEPDTKIRELFMESMK